MEFSGGFQTGLFTDTRARPTSDDKHHFGWPRQRFFAETRKRDEGDAEAHRRGALTTYSAEKIGAATGMFVNNAV